MKLFECIHSAIEWLKRMFGYRFRNLFEEVVGQVIMAEGCSWLLRSSRLKAEREVTGHRSAERSAVSNQKQFKTQNSKLKTLAKRHKTQNFP
jgi:hypothetical protein